MALTDKQIEQIKNAAIAARKAGKPLFPARAKPKAQPKPAEFTEDAIFTQMKKLGRTIR